MSRHVAKPSSAVQLLKVDGITAPVEVRRHPRARRLTLRVSRTRHAVVLTMPRNCEAKEADLVLAKSLDWLRERLERVPEPVPFAAGATMPLRGVLHAVDFAGARTLPGRSIVDVVAGPSRGLARLVVHGTAEHAPRRLKDWLVGEAGRDLDVRVQHHSKNLGLRPRRITLRDQRSRWGSCTPDGQLSFSWRLVMAPPFVLDYVAAHEVAHLAEMNHGPRFWRLVERTMPGLEEAKVWLRLHGMELYRYGVER